MVLESQYSKAIHLIDSGDLGSALDILQMISNYSNVQEFIDGHAGLQEEIKARYQAYISAYDVGNTVEYGKYDNHALRWEVLAAKGNERLLITTGILMFSPYDSSTSVWSECSLRKKLQSLASTMFTNEERNRILATENSNTKGGKTSDKLFLLSVDETKRYFKNNEHRSIGKAWITRTPGQKEGKIQAVASNGKITEHFADGSMNGIRPAMWIKLDELTRKTQGNSYTIGSSGKDVVVLQQALIDQGFLSGSADGSFGKMTAEAVKKAQTAFGMEATGIADSAFQSKLYSK